MRLAGEANHLGIDPQLFQGNINLLPLFDIAAQILFAMNNQRRRFGVADIFER